MSGFLQVFAFIFLFVLAVLAMGTAIKSDSQFIDECHDVGGKVVGQRDWFCVSSDGRVLNARGFQR